MKNLIWGLILAGTLTATSPAAHAQPAIAEARDARSWQPGVADARGRVINPIFRKEQDRPAPIDRGIDPDTLPAAGDTSHATPSGPQAGVSPVTRREGVR